MVRHLAILALIVVVLAPRAGTAASAPPPTVATLERAAFQFTLLPTDEQAQRARQARALAQEWLRYYTVAEPDGRPRMSVRRALIRSLLRHLNRNPDNLHRFLPEAVEDLESACRLDPTYLAAHVALARLHYESGRRQRAAAHGEFVHRFVTAQRDSVADPEAAAAPWLAEEAAGNLAWIQRDLGAWQSGLDAVAVDRRFREELGLGDSGRLQLIEALLLAGAGRGAEALRMSHGVLPEFWSFKLSAYKQLMPYRRVSIYAQDWVQSQVFLQEGELALAMSRTAEQALDRRDDWTMLPYYRHYWNDVGFLYELRGEGARAARWYEQLERLRLDWFVFFEPILGERPSLKIGDLPAGQVRHVRSADHDYLWGSPFAYIASELGRLADLADPSGAEAAAIRRRILAVVGSLEARNARPDFCHAVRGRLAYLAEDLVTAESELSEALALFAGRGVADPGSSLILGLVKLGLGKDAEAEQLLAAAPDDALALRGLGVILARRGEFEGALASLNRALQLQPRSAAGYFNRGMLLFENGRHAAALEDFRRARSLAPDDPRLQTWIAHGEDLQAALALEPSTGEDYLRRGKLFLAAGELERARSDLLEAFRLAPQHSQEIAPLLQQTRHLELGRK